MPDSISSKVVLITGANQGIGFEIAKAFSLLTGYHVLMGSRDAQRGLDAAKKLQNQSSPVDSITIDVTSNHSIEAAAQHIRSQFGRLDVLINNAGVCLNSERNSPPSLKTFQETFSVNTFGAALTTEAFVPLLSASTAPRVVFMSSFMGSLLNRPLNPAPLPIYRSSKAALNMIMLHYALEFKDRSWKVNASCPGFCSTNLNAFMGTDTPMNGALNAVRLATLGEDGETGTFTNKEGKLDW